MAKLDDVYFGILLRIKSICRNTITWCDKEQDKLIVKDPGLSGYKQKV